MINSKNKGTAYELKLIKELKELLKTDNIMSTRLGSRYLDNHQVDIMGDVPVHIQAKALEVHPKSHDILKGMPTDKPRCIFWKKNHKKELVIMEKEEFYKLLLTMTKK